MSGRALKVSALVACALLFGAVAEEPHAVSKTSDAFRTWAAERKLAVDAGTKAQGANLQFVADVSDITTGDWIPEQVWNNAGAFDFVFLDGSGDAIQAPTRAKLLTAHGVMYFLFECRDGDAERPL